MTSKFQQRHYEVIAQLLQDEFPRNTDHKQSRAEYRERLISAFVAVFEADNSNFNPERFRAAVVPGANVRGRGNVGPSMQFYKVGP